MILFPYWHNWHHIGCIQHTLPLLFDDCLTILEKLDALWCKLNDLIADYDEFKTDFETWKDEVEDTLDEIIAALDGLDDRLTAVESDIVEIKQDIADIKSDITSIKSRLTTLETTVTNLSNTVSSLGDTVSALSNTVNNLNSTVTSLGNDISALAARVTALENLLNNLNIIVPEELFKENDIDWFITNVATPWLQQMALSPSVYTPLRKIIPVASDVGTIPAVSFKVGVLGFPIVQAKIPLMFSFTPGSNITDVPSFLANIHNDPTMKNFVRAVQDKSTSADAFAHITLYNAPTFNPSDNIKFEGNYAIFEQPGSTSPTVGVEYLADDTFKGIRTSNCQVGIRMALTRGSNDGYLAIAVDKICCYYCSLDSKVYIMLLSEHQ